MFIFLFLISLNLYPLKFHKAKVKPVVNRNYLPVLIDLVNNAKKEIKFLIFQARYYSGYRNDPGRQIIDALIRAKKRGVYVEGVLDYSEWNKSNTIKNYQFSFLLKQAGIKVYFDPMPVTSHPKIVMVDSQYLLIGSTNWSFYALKSNNEANILIKSPEVVKEFLDYYELVKSLGDTLPDRYKIKPEKRRPEESSASPPSIDIPPYKGDWIDGEVMVIPNRLYIWAFYRILKNAKKEIKVAMLKAPPSLNRKYSSNELLLRVLNKLAERGVKIDILFENSNYAYSIYLQNKDFADLLVDKNVDVWFDRPDIGLHAKLVVIDDYLTILGSTNWTYYAFELNNETAVVIKSKKVAKYYKWYIEQLKKAGAFHYK